MMNYLLFVLIPNLDNFFGALGFIGSIAGVIALILCIFNQLNAYDDEDKRKAKEYRKHALKIVLASVSMFFITCFIPSKKDMLQLKAMSIITELNGVEQIPQKLIDRLNDLLDQNKDIPNNQKDE